MPVFLFVLSCLLWQCDLFADPSIQTIEYHHQGQTLQAKLYVPTENRSKYATLLMAPSWQGQDSLLDQQALEFVKLGYAVFVLDLYGNAKQIDDLQRARKYGQVIASDRPLLRGRMQVALDICRKQEAVDAQCIVAVGSGLGGIAALELARSGAKLKGILSISSDLGTPVLDDAQNIQSPIFVVQGAEDSDISASASVTFQKEMLASSQLWQINTYSGRLDNRENPSFPKAQKAIKEFLKDVFLKPSLEEQIAAFQKKSRAMITEDMRKTMKQALDDLVATGIARKALKQGDRLPKVALLNSQGQKELLSDRLKKGPLVLNFYRGSWCPYCNLELMAWKDQLEALRAKGADIVAISPELPDRVAQTEAKNALGFDLLSDSNNALAKSLGLVFSLPEDLQKLYLDFGIDLPQFNGHGSQELPIPATYLVDRKGVIQVAFVDPDYTRRLEPAELIAILE